MRTANERTRVVCRATSGVRAALAAGWLLLALAAMPRPVRAQIGET
jgi:hypothetical protein